VFVGDELSTKGCRGEEKSCGGVFCGNAYPDAMYMIALTLAGRTCQAKRDGWRPERFYGEKHA
jgi:hypothetical protein